MKKAIEKAQAQQSEVETSELLEQEIPKNFNQKREITWREIREITSKYGAEEYDYYMYLSEGWRHVCSFYNNLVVIRSTNWPNIFNFIDFGIELKYSDIRNNLLNLGNESEIDERFLREFFINRTKGIIPSRFLEKVIAIIMEIKNLE